MGSDPQAPLKSFAPKHDFFVGIDSDGCVFDTMEVKHKECFIPNIIKFYDLAAVSKYAREAGEFVNLYSKHRGINRWPALLMVFDLLAERPEVQRRGVKLPDVPTLREWAKTEKALGNPQLKAAVERTGDPVLEHALAWSEAVNAAVAEMVKGVGPFPFVRESLEKITRTADVVVVSQTPTEALIREWQEHDLTRGPDVIAGQEMGSKTDHLALAAHGKYPPNHILMIGDAPGDRKAARINAALFYPILPGREEDSWQKLFEQDFDKFVKGRFAGPYEQQLNDEFDRYLPAAPPWEK